MGWKSILYQDARPKMKAGDVIAFSGKGDFSEIIKWATRAPVSHVGVILQSKLLIDGDSQSGMLNQIIESTSLNGFSGVSISRLSDRLDTYDGELWWLPLSEKVNSAMDKKKFYDFLIHQERKEYDMPQAIKSALDVLDKVPVIGKTTHNVEDFSRFFCSELVAAGLEAAGAISNINASEVTPIDLCSFSIFDSDYFQLKGNRKEIRGFNAIDPAGWGE
ncbi:MAG: hypothetical protein V2B20_16020 [Pseudomonadota bacterium]